MHAHIQCCSLTGCVCLDQDQSSAVFAMHMCHTEESHIGLPCGLIRVKLMSLHAACAKFIFSRLQNTALAG